MRSRAGKAAGADRRCILTAQGATYAISLLLFTALLSLNHALAAERLFVVNKSDNSVSILDLSTGVTIGTVPTAEGPHEIALSPDGTRAAVSNYGPDDKAGNSLSIFATAAPYDPELIDLGKWRRPHGVAWLSDGRHLLVTSEIGAALLLVDTEAKAVRAAIATTQVLSHMVAVDAERQRAYVANIESGSLSVIDMHSGTLHRVIETGRGAEGVAVAPGSGDVWVTNREEDSIAIVEPELFTVKQRLPAGRMPVRIAFTPDGARALVSNALGGSLSVYGTDPPELIREIDVSGHYRLTTGRWLGGVFGMRVFSVGLTVSHDNARAYVANTYGGVVLEIDLVGFETLRTLTAGVEPDGLAYWPGR